MTDALKSSATKHWLLENLKEMHIPAEHISTLVAAASSSAAVHHHGEGAAAPVKEEGGVPRDVASGGNDDGETDGAVDGSGAEAGAHQDGCDGDGNDCKPRVVGFVSAARSGVGRCDNDRQFLYINGRPVDLPRLTKTLNETWRQFMMKQKPAAVLDLRLPPGSFDVNVTPDKRTIFLEHEDLVYYNCRL